MHSEVMYAEHAEKTLLGLIVVDGVKAMEGAIRLRPEMFYLHSNQVLFGLLRELASEGEEWEGQSLIAAVEKRKLESSLPSQWRSWLIALTEGLPYRIGTERFAFQIIDAWRRRKGAELCQHYGSGFKIADDAVDHLGALQNDILQVIAETSSADDPLVIHHCWPEYERFLEQTSSHELSRGLSYGNESLNDWTYGMQPGEVTVVGARSGVGKSSAMCQAIAANCRAGISADCFSLEMARGKVLRRLWAIESGVEYKKIHRPFLANADERRAIREAALRISDWPLRIYDDSSMTIEEIVARARVSARHNACKLVCVDYAQIVAGEGKDDRTRVSSVSSKLRTLAKGEGCHVMLLSQLRKVSPEYYSHPPTAGDLRETGQIENDAHVIVLLHRPWDGDRMRISDDASLLIPKCRDGGTGALEARFDERSLTFA